MLTVQFNQKILRFTIFEGNCWIFIIELTKIVPIQMIFHEDHLIIRNLEMKYLIIQNCAKSVSF